MRSCRVCGRELPESAFAMGTNWRDCKRCKSHQVQMRAQQRKGRQDVIRAFEASGMEYIQDFLKKQARRERILGQPVKVAPKISNPLDPERRFELGVRLIFARLLVENAEGVELLAFFQERARRRMHQQRWAAKRAEKFRRDPELVRAKERARRAKKPELYKALDAASSARSRSRRPSSVIPLNVVWDAAGGRCGICGETCDPEWWHLDHIVPLAAGGAHELTNVAPAHPYCNLHKGKKTNDMIDADWLRATRPAWEASEAAERLRKGGSAPCGTDARYGKGCRCDECREAHRIKSRERRARQRGRDNANAPGTKFVPWIPDPATVPHEGDDEYLRLRAEGVLATVARRESGVPLARARYLDA